MNPIALEVHYLCLISQYKSIKDVQIASYGLMQASLQMRGNSVWQQIEAMRKHHPEITEQIDNNFKLNP